MQIDGVWQMSWRRARALWAAATSGLAARALHVDAEVRVAPSPAWGPGKTNVVVRGEVRAIGIVSSRDDDDPSDDTAAP